MCLVAAAGCIAVSLLPNSAIYPALHRVMPLFRAIRVWARAGQMALVMLAVAAGFGVAGLGRRIRDTRVWTAVAFVLFGLVQIEALRAPIEYVRFDGIPAIYDRLATERDAVLVELPMYEPRAFFANAPYMLNSTRHWRPMLDGYSGIRPDSYDVTFNLIDGFPDDRALIALHERGVTHVIVHEQAFTAIFGRARYEAVLRAPALRPAAEEGDIHIFRLR
jgi:hypothetical protein